MDFERALTLVMMAAAGGFAVLGGTLAMRKRASKDARERAEDTVQTEWLAKLIDERDEARRAVVAYQERITALERQNAEHVVEIEDLKHQIVGFKKLMLRNFPDTKKFIETDFADL